MPEHQLLSPLVIAIDGPAASGKSTLARILSNFLGFALLKTGILYRKVALLALQNHVDPDDTDTLVSMAQQICKDTYLFEERAGLYGDEVSLVASQVAKCGGVRRTFLPSYRAFIEYPPKKAPGIVIEGRDAATVICPDGDVKIFLTASLEVRTKRRYQELEQTQASMSFDSILFDSILNEIKIRDENDLQRTVDPLVPAEDAFILDTTELFGVQAVFEIVIDILNKKPIFLPYTSSSKRCAAS